MGSSSGTLEVGPSCDYERILVFLLLTLNLQSLVDGVLAVLTS